MHCFVEQYCLDELRIATDTCNIFIRYPALLLLMWIRLSKFHFIHGRIQMSPITFLGKTCLRFGAIFPIRPRLSSYQYFLSNIVLSWIKVERLVHINHALFHFPAYDVAPSRIFQMPVLCLNLFCIGIAEVMGSNPVQAWIFFRLKFHNCLSSVYSWDDQS